MSNGAQIFRFTVWSGRPTPGSALMNLRYRDERQFRRSASAAPDQAGLPKSPTAVAQVPSAPWSPAHMNNYVKARLAALAVCAVSGIARAQEEQPVSHAELYVYVYLQGAMGRSGLEGAGLSRCQRGLYGLGVVFLRYLWARADQFSAAQHWGDLPRGCVAPSSACGSF